MPEYLAPGVYVEEIDTGSKPIEGVSTSTAGMIGVTERGPVNVPILITSYGEFRRWFGDRLFSDLYGEHRFLPHAIEGFFTNGGKRVFVTRILASEAASTSNTPLFVHDESTISATLLTRGAAADDSVLFVWPGAPGSIAANDFVRIGSGSDAEYRQASGAPSTASTSIVTTLPLQRTHALSPNNIEHYAALPSVDVTCSLNGHHPAGAIVLVLTNVSGTVNADRVVQIVRPGTPESREELIYIKSAVHLGANNWRIGLETPLQLDHDDADEVRVLNALSMPADVTALTRVVVSGDNTSVVASNSGFVANQFLRITEGARGEFCRIGSPHVIDFGVPTSSNLVAGTYIEHVTRADNTTITEPIKTLESRVEAGSMVLTLTDRQDLQVGQVLRVGAPNDPDVEYAVIRELPFSVSSGPNPGRVVLEAPLQRSHGDVLLPTRQIVAVQNIKQEAQGATVAHACTSGVTSILSTGSLLTAAPVLDDLIRIVVPGVPPKCLRITSHTTKIVQQLNLVAPLQTPHAAPQPIVARNELLTVFALDPGAWGNRLSVSVQHANTPLARTRIQNNASGIQDPTHIRLDSAAGVEVGTILSLADSSGMPIETPFKVEAIDRQNGYLLTLNAPLPALAGQGSPIVSIEFALTTYLLRQPDPAQSSRNNQILDSETFRNLSLDDRHSRYIQRVIGTTWVPGSPEDKDGQPVRLVDRRSEGESSYIRIRDVAQDLTEPTRTNTLHSIRLGPEMLVDTINGRQQSARRALVGGDDQTTALSDDHYIGVDDTDPDKRTGLQSLRNIEEISILACPGRTTPAIQGTLIAHCELMRYRFAVLDGTPPPKDSIVDIQNQRQQFDTKYAALYHPWVLIPDPFPTTLGVVTDVAIPPSGHMLGVYARTDIERGVHKAPANEVVRGILGLQRTINKEQHDILNPYPVNINVIRDFRENNRGIRVYGGRVITSDSDWKYVNVRRLIIFIEASIDRGLQWVVFEPNAEPLWARVRRSITNFLTLVWRNGALEGTKPEEAFFVKCDRTTMTQTDIDSGRLIAVVGVAPVKPAEFVIVRIGLWTAHADE